MRRKRLILIAVALLLAMGAAFSSMAAAGWKQDGNAWVYLDGSGNRESQVWKKGADGLWRYLDANGEMVINAWVEDTYYMDSNGILVTDKWLKIPAPGENTTNTDDYNWYYFGSSGKMVSDAWKKIDNKWYYFDSDGVMQTGWIDNDMYYAGSDGVMKTGWQLLYAPGSDELNNDQTSPSDGDTDDGRHWYYFASNGKKKIPETNGGEYGESKINGYYYCFDEDGAMQTGWVNMGSASDEDASIGDYKYFDTDGKARVGWYSIEPPEPILNRYEHSVEWFYFNSNGTPKTGPAEGNAKSSDLVKIKGHTYLFNDLGNPVYGLQKVEVGGSYTSYYFGDRKTSTMQTGKIKVDEGGSETQYYFQTSGRGYSGVYDGYLYYMGRLQKAGSGNKYAVVTIPEGSSHRNYVVSTTGKIAKNTTVRTGDNVKLKTNSSGVLVKLDDEDVASGDRFDEPEEPYWEYR